MPCAAMPPWGGYDSYTGPGGTTADGLIRQCSMLKVRSESLMAGYNEWHAKVWPELQTQIRLSGAYNYSIFQRADGLLFLYMESNPALSEAKDTNPDWESINAKWGELMEPFLDPEFEFNGPLEHVMYMDADPIERSMDPVAPSTFPPSLAPNPPYGKYTETFTGGGGWTLDGRVRQAQQLKCRPDAASMAAYNEWHRKVWPELQVQGFEAGNRNYSIFQRKDGLLFLYGEVDTRMAAAATSTAEKVAVNEKWQTMMDEVGLDRNWEHNGPLEHVMYIGDDRTMVQP